MTVRGIGELVLPPLREDILNYCSGPGVRVVPGTVIHVLLLPRVVIWKYYNGPAVRAVHGTRVHVLLLLVAVI